MRVLSVHAHPDDAEFLCGGTLALLARRNCEITILTCCRGDCGSAELAGDEIAAIRLEEARRAAAVIGARYETLGYGDLQLVFDNPTRRRIADAFRRWAPDIVFTACREDYMADHTVCGELAREACFTAPLPNYDTGVSDGAPTLPRVPHLYYCDPIEMKDAFGDPVRPALCVDVSSVIETKREMLACHASQREWLLRHHGIDEYLESMRTWSRARGELAGVEFAEGFRPHLGHAYPHSNLLAELLGDLVHPVH